MTGILDILYSEKIEHLASHRINEEVYNSSDDRAKIILTAMLRHAVKKVKILCGSMCTEVSNDPEFLNELREFLDKRKGQLEIILCDYSDELTSRPVYSILKQFREQVSIKRTEKKYYYNGRVVHFTVVDENAFRLETDIDERMSRANFNDPAGAKKLSQFFKEMNVEAQLLETV